MRATIAKILQRNRDINATNPNCDTLELTKEERTELYYELESYQKMPEIQNFNMFLRKRLVVV